MLGRGSGMQAWYNSLGLVPNAASMFTRSLGDAAENIAARQRADNAEERRRRDIKTAERKQRQGMLTSLGIGVGGAAAGAGIGAALATPLGAAAPIAGAAAGGAGGGLSSAATQPPVSTPSSFTGSYELPVATGTPNAQGTYGLQPTTAPAPTMTDYRSAVPPDGTSVFPDQYGPPSLGGGKTFTPPTTQPYSGQMSMTDLGPGPMFDMPQQPKFGYLGNSRGAVFGNLFLQGLGGVVPGMAGVAQGIDTANRFNYQMGRDTISDQFQMQRLGIADAEQRAREAYYNRGGGRGGLGRPTDFMQNYETLLKLDPKAAESYMKTYSNMAPDPAALNPFSAYELELKTFGNPTLWSPEQITRAKEIGQAVRQYQGGGGLSAPPAANVAPPPPPPPPKDNVPEFTAEESAMIDTMPNETEKEKLRQMFRRRKGA